MICSHHGKYDNDEQHWAHEKILMSPFAWLAQKKWLDNVFCILLAVTDNFLVLSSLPQKRDEPSFTNGDNGIMFPSQHVQ